MSNNILIIPKFAGQDLPISTLENYQQIMLVTNKQESLPMNVVASLLQLASKLHIEFLEIEFNSDIELLFSLAFKISQIASLSAGAQISFITDDKRFESLINVANANGFNTNIVSAGLGETTISAPHPVKPRIAEVPKPPRPAPSVEEQPKPMVKPVAASSSSNNNKAMLSGLLNS